MDRRGEVAAARLELALPGAPEVAHDLAGALPLRLFRLLLVRRSERARRLAAGPEVAACEAQLRRPVRELARDLEPALGEVRMELRADRVHGRKAHLPAGRVDVGADRRLDRASQRN